MRKRVVAAKQNFILKYLLSYFAIMVISLMFSWGLYGYTAGLLKKNAEKNSLQALEQTKEVMTGHIREAELYLNQLANDPEILQFMYLNNKSKTEEMCIRDRTTIYLPHFVSWVVFGSIIIQFLMPSTGIVNAIIKMFGGEPIFFLAEPKYFRGIVVITEIIK